MSDSVMSLRCLTVAFCPSAETWQMRRPSPLAQDQDVECLMSTADDDLAETSFRYLCSRRKHPVGDAKRKFAQIGVTRDSTTR